MKLQPVIHCLILPLLLICGACTSRTGGKPVDYEEVLADPEFTSEELDQIAKLPELFGVPAKVILFEGMPHPMFEEELLAKEISLNALIQIDGQKFYKHSQILGEIEASDLLSLLSAKSTHRPCGMMKLCGGFHADYALRWKAKKGTLTVLVCLGCHEMVIMGPGLKLRTDISDEAYSKLKLLLTKYQKLRPETARLR